MHTTSKTSSGTKEMDTVKRSLNPSVVLTANGEVHTHEEAHVFVHGLNQFVTVPPLEDTLPVVSLGKLLRRPRILPMSGSAVRSHD